jgi:hypothetical protein
MRAIAILFLIVGISFCLFWGSTSLAAQPSSDPIDEQLSRYADEYRGLLKVQDLDPDLHIRSLFVGCRAASIDPFPLPMAVYLEVAGISARRLDYQDQKDLLQVLTTLEKKRGQAARWPGSPNKQLEVVWYTLRFRLPVSYGKDELHRLMKLTPLPVVPKWVWSYRPNRIWGDTSGWDDASLDVYLPLLQAKLLWLNGETEAALISARRAFEQGPNNKSCRWGYAILLLKNEEVKLGLEVLRTVRHAP